MALGLAASRVTWLRGCGLSWGAKDEQISALTASLEAALAALEGERELRRRLELRVAELERRLSMDSTDSGTPSSKERIGAKEARKARQQSERERRKDRKRGGQPGHQGKGLDLGSAVQDLAGIWKWLLNCEGEPDPGTSPVYLAIPTSWGWSLRVKIGLVQVAARRGRCRVRARVGAVLRARGVGRWVRAARDAGPP
jgi:hypothetical protein